MDDGAEASREYERLRAELADFVLNALAERIASGKEPRLSDALVEAIDRKVDAAVEERLTRSKWPDPDAFARDVLAAAGAQGSGGGERPPASASRPRSGETRSRNTASGKSTARSTKLTNLQIALFTLIGIAIVAVITTFVLRNMSGTGTTMVRNQQTNQIEAEQPNGQQPQDPANAATSAGAVTNVQGENR
jgi:hypothetical protein